jgi:hypothetical protein
MRSRGNINLLLATILIVTYFTSWAVSQSNNYCLLAYAGNEESGNNILFQKIDLDSKSIVLSQTIDLTGELHIFNPAPILNNRDTIYLISTLDGHIGKNSDLANQEVTKYALLNSYGVPLKFGEIPFIHFLKFNFNNTVPLEINYLDGNKINKWGTINIDSSLNITIRFTHNKVYDTLSYPQIIKFRYFKNIVPTNDNLYWDGIPDGNYLLKMNGNSRILQDSVKLFEDSHFNCLAGLSPSDSLIYVFNIYNHITAEPESLARITSSRGYTKILWASNFALVDSIPIEDPPVEAGYIGSGSGPCDRVGPYLVYYFSRSDGMVEYSPAMLFIFDTRNNQATWLRVGWR